MKKGLIYVTLLLLLIIPIKLNAIVTKSEKEFVTDEANLLTETSENYIVRYSEFLYKAKKIDYYVVTVKNLEGIELEEYTDKVYKEFKLNDKGIIILVSKDDRKLRVQVGEKLLNIIDSEVIDEYIDTYFMPYLEQEKWNDGIINGYSALYKYICEENGIDATTMEVIDKLDFISKYKTPIMLVIVWLITVFAKYYGKINRKFKQKNINKMTGKDLFILMMVLITNILVVSVSYLLEPVYIIFALIFEGIFLYSNLVPMTNQRIKKEKREKNSNKKKRKRK